MIKCLLLGNKLPEPKRPAQNNTEGNEGSDLHNNPSVEEPVFPLVAVISNGLLADVGPTFLRLRHTVCDTGHLVRHTNLTLPLVLWNCFQWRFHALQVVDCRAGLTAQQVTQAVTHAAVVVVLHAAVRHELLAGDVGG